MTTKKQIDDFLSHRTLALAGVSHNGKKFGNTALAGLKEKGYKVLIVHPEAQELDGEPCYPSLPALPEGVGGVVLVVPPAQTEKMVKEAHASGIRRVWMQPGAESAAAVQFWQAHAMEAITGECIMMYPKANGFHNFHRVVRSFFGGMPK